MILGGIAGIGGAALGGEAWADAGVVVARELGGGTYEQINFTAGWTLLHKPGYAEFLAKMHERRRRTNEWCRGASPEASTLPEMALPAAQQALLRECGTYEEWARWRREHEDRRTAKLATPEGWTPPGAR